mgnify:CR=1 FL=1
MAGVFDSGFNVLTGETGAGKSIVIDAISAILGERASREMIRTGAQKAFVSAIFSGVPELPWFAENQVPYEPELGISREIFADGKNSCRVGGKPVTVSTLRRLGVQLIQIHGQNDSQQLFDEATSSGDFGLSKEEFERFNKLSDFMLDRFDINFGNRIYNQIMKFVPVYVACGGTAAKALDIMFSRKILRKMEGRFDDGLKTDITALETLINELYGKETFSLTLDAVNKLKRKLI